MCIPPLLSVLSFSLFSRSQRIQILYNGFDVSLYANRLVCDLLGNPAVFHIDTGVDCVGVFRSHLPERIFYDAGGVIPHPQFQVENVLPFLLANKITIAGRRPMPVAVLHKGTVNAQIHCHGGAAMGTIRDQPGGNFHVSLPLHHLHHLVFILVCFLTAGPCTLPSAIISLGIKQPVPIKPVFLKQMVYVCGDYKITRIPYQV